MAAKGPNGSEMLALPLIFLIRHGLAMTSELAETDSYGRLKNELTVMNSELQKVNAITAYLAWGLSTVSDPDSPRKSLRFGEIRTEWRNNWCSKLTKIFRNVYNDNFFGVRVQPNWVFDNNYHLEFRQYYFLCRGPKYTLHQAREVTNLLGQLQNVYQTTQVCNKYGRCFRGEPDLERIMSKSRDPEVLSWAWQEWRNAVGPPSRLIYPSMVAFLNQGARNNGYHDIGECWREELEVPGLERLVEDLYRDIEPLYQALHAVVRYRLHLYYGNDTVHLDQPIPAHLLGNMWAQNWESLLSIIINTDPKTDLTYNLRRKNYTVTDLVKRAEDFYVSLGFQPMTPAFWKYSKFENNNSESLTCHGTAANMFKGDDYRMLLCAEVDEDDFYVIHHEMGHIEYYTEYKNQPTIFQDGANSGFQEAIGDAIMYGVMSPAHLHRLGLTETIDQTPESDIRFLLHQALSKLPQIPFALALEKWRWDVFKGDISPQNYNEAWWNLRRRYQGIKSPVPRTEEHFDPASKFHINDNTPYVRYFLSSVLQMQIFEALCKGAVFGGVHRDRALPLYLHRCDIYGSKNAAEPLRRMMSLGSSITWQEALEMVVGQASYSVRPLLDYYKPLYRWLKLQIEHYDIPEGWN